MTIQGLQHTDYPAIIRNVTAAEYALHSTEAPAHPGIMYRVDDTALYRWNGTTWVAFAAPA